MTWNYRVVKENDCYSIREVYYEKGKPTSWTKDGIPVYGEDYKDLVYDFFLMEKAFRKPVLVVKKNKLVKEKQ